jgi:HSP20 family protein
MFRVGDDLMVRFELPGIKPEDVDISITERILTVKGKRELEPELRVEDARMYCGEGHYGTFERSLTVPEGTTMENVRAEYANGLLAITIPGAAARIAARKVKIPIHVAEKAAIEETKEEKPAE